MQHSIQVRVLSPARRITLPLFLLLGAGLMLVQPCAGASFEFEVTGSLRTPRLQHTSTLLPNGKVLVTGGTDLFFTFASAELYDPARGTWTATGSLATPRTHHIATLLPNGNVLVIGGRDFTIGVLASAELYDPASGTWTATGSLATARAVHTATLLPSGMVLVAGGRDFLNVNRASAELYDPVGGTWTATGSLATQSSDHTATLLANGNVLVVAGDSGGAIRTLRSCKRDLDDYREPQYLPRWTHSYVATKWKGTYCRRRAAW